MDHLPLILRLVAAAVLRKQHQALLSEIALLRAENRFYRQQLPHRRFAFSVAWKRRFATLGAAIGWKRLEGILTVAAVGTVRRWHALVRKKALSSPPTPQGRPRTTPRIEKLIIRMATENPSWGYLRIAGELRKLGIRVGRTTIADILRRQGIEPIDPQRRTRESSWKQFISEHKTELAAVDFFTVDVWSWLGWRIGKQTIYVLFAMHLATRKVEILGTTDHPSEAFMKQVARNVTMDETGWLTRNGVRYLIQDRDTKFCESFRTILQLGGVKAVRLPPKSPNLNAFAERWVRTVKNECLRKLTLLGIGGLNRALREYLKHYHQHRPHQALGNAPPASPIQKLDPLSLTGRIRSKVSCQGVLRHYYREAA